jgi:hypothetical protein
VLSAGKGALVNRDHSRIIVILLAGILAVLLFGREAVQGSLQVLFWVVLGVGTVGLIVWAIIAFSRYMGREVRAYQAEIRRHREEGQPWLHTYIACPGIIGNFLVFGVAAYSRYVEESCRLLMGDCLQQLPYWWLPVSLLLSSIPIAGLERVFLYFRNRKTAE